MHITISTENSYELVKIILEFIGTIIWPITILIIVHRFSNEIKKLIVNAKKVELPGGFSLETIEHDITQAKELSIEVKKERNPETQKKIEEANSSFETEANKRMIEIGLKPSPSGLDINYYRNITNYDPRLAVVGLRADLEIMLKNLAKGFNVTINDYDSAKIIISKLFDKGAITTKQFQLLNTLFRIGNLAVHGAPITKDQVLEILDIATVLVKDYVAWLYWGFGR
jgi:hypothetical protein